MSKQQITCRCSSYKFPHRQGSGRCGQTRKLLSHVESVTGYIEDGDEAAEWVNMFNGDVDKAAEYWLDELRGMERTAVGLVF